MVLWLVVFSLAAFAAGGWVIFSLARSHVGELRRRHGRELSRLRDRVQTLRTALRMGPVDDDPDADVAEVAKLYEALGDDACDCPACCRAQAQRLAFVWMWFGPIGRRIA